MTNQDVAIARVLKAIDAIKDGGMVIMVDDEDRENEGDLVFAAAHVNAEKINFMTKEARGLICLSLDPEGIDRLKLPMMEDTTKRGGTKSTAFTVSIEAAQGVTTGISAADRAHTIRVASNPAATPDDIIVPGHIFPLKARVGGVLQRAGHTEGSVDLARLAGCTPAAVICEIMNDDGSMARLPDLERFASKHHIPIVTIADLVTFRLMRESLIEEVASAPLKTPYGEFKTLLFRSLSDNLTHMAVIKGEAFGDEIVDVRVHRQRSLLDVFSGWTQDNEACRIAYAMRMLRDNDRGVLLYLTRAEPTSDMAREFSKLTNYRDNGQQELLYRDGGGVHPARSSSSARSWIESDPHMLGIGAQVLRVLGVRRMRVHMTQPTQLKGLLGFELEVVDTVAIDTIRD